MLGRKVSCVGFELIQRQRRAAALEGVVDVRLYAGPWG
jgi:hypothetical protein